MDRLEGRRSSVLLASLLIGVAFLGALVIDRFLVPPSYIVTSFQAAWMEKETGFCGSFCFTSCRTSSTLESASLRLRLRTYVSAAR